MMFHRHKWTDWSIDDKGTITYFGDVVGWFLVQERHCLVCGKTQMADQANYGSAPRYMCKRHPTLAGKTIRKDGLVKAASK